MKKLFVASLAAAVVALTSACATLEAGSTAIAVAVNAGISVVTTVYIQHKGGGTAAGEAAVAAQVISLVQALQPLTTGPVTVAQFNTALAAAVAKLPANLQAIAADLLPAIDVYFAQLVANPANAPITASAQVAVGQVLNDINAAAQFFNVSAPKIKVGLR